MDEQQALQRRAASDKREAKCGVVCGSGPDPGPRHPGYGETRGFHFPSLRTKRHNSLETVRQGARWGWRAGSQARLALLHQFLRPRKGFEGWGALRALVMIEPWAHFNLGCPWEESGDRHGKSSPELGLSGRGGHITMA